MEELVSKKLEAKLWEIPGVEDVYSVSMNSMSVVTVKFYVGQDKERSLVKLYDKIMSNMDVAPPGASQPLVKPIDVDDVPIVAITLSGRRGRITMTPSCGSWPTMCSTNSGRCRAWATRRSSAAGAARCG